MSSLVFLLAILGQHKYTEEKSAIEITRNTKYIDSEIKLNGLTELTNSVVNEVLSKRHKKIYLNNVTKINTDQLSTPNANGTCLFYLDGIKCLDKKTCIFLSGFKRISLAGIKNMTEDCAKILSGLDELHLNGINGISPKTAELLSSIKTLSLPCIKNSDKNILQAFCDKETNLILDGITSLDKETVEILGSTFGSTFLGGIKALDERIVENLCFCKNSHVFYFPNVELVSDLIFDKLLKQKFLIELPNIKKTSPAMINYLSIKNKSHFNLKKIDHLDLQSAFQFIFNKFIICDMSGLKKIGLFQAFCLGTCGGRLNLSGLKNIENTSLFYLVFFTGELDLSGIETLTSDQFFLLRNHNGSLILNGLKNINEKDAKILGEHRGSISLDGIKKLPYKTFCFITQILANNKKKCYNYGSSASYLKSLLYYHSFENPSLSLNSISDFTFLHALCLTNKKGTLWFNSIKYINWFDSIPLVWSKCGINLDGINEIIFPGSFFLLTKSNQLSFSGLKNIDAITFLFLGFKSGQLNLSSLEYLPDSKFNFFNFGNGHVILTGLKFISYENALVFSQRPGIIYLNKNIFATKATMDLLNRHPFKMDD